MLPRLRTWSSGVGPPLVIQAPAWGPSSHYLRSTLVPLLEGLRVVTFDPRNVGCSERLDAPDSQALEHLVDDLESLRRHLGLEQFMLAGHSHGGFVAMAYAVRHPGRLSAMILMNTKVRRLDRDTERESVLAELAAEAKRGDALAMFRATSGRPGPVSGDAELARQMRRLLPAYFYDLEAMERFAAEAKGADPPSAHALARTSEDLEPWVEEGLQEIAAPVLVLTGRYDVVTTPADARYIHDRLPRSSLEIFEHSGHHPWAEEPRAFVRAVRGFVASLGSSV